MLVNHAVVDSARFVIAELAGKHQLSAQCSAELSQRQPWDHAAPLLSTPGGNWMRFSCHVSDYLKTRHMRSNVVVQSKLVRVRSLADSLDFILHLVVDPGFQQFLAEYVPFEQEIMVLFQRAEGLFQ